MVKVAVNIDTVEYSISGDENRFEIAGATRVRVIGSEGEILDGYQNRVNVPGKYVAHSSKIRSMNSGRKLKVEGPLCASMYGQNIYTTSNLRNLVVPHLKHISRKFKLKPTPVEKTKWENGDINLHRIDLAANFRLESESEVLGVINQIKHQLAAQGRAARIYDSSVMWTPRDGKYFSICIYAKGPQMRRSKRFNQLAETDKHRLYAECETILRIEVRLREPELRNLGLSKVSDWDENSAQKVFSSYMKKLNFLNITSGPFLAEEIKPLPGRLRAPWALHKMGANLSLIFNPRTLQRHLSAFRNLGIDLKCPNQDATTAVKPLNKVLSPRKAIKAAPKWMKLAGLAPTAKPNSN